MFFILFRSRLKYKCCQTIMNNNNNYIMMYKRIITTIACLFTAFTVVYSAGPQKKLHTIGDATMLEDETGKCGWVQMLSQYFTDNVSINNRGKSGASSKSFYIEAPLWQSLVKGGKDEMHEGDFLLIQFAHNDEKNNGADGAELKEYFTRQGALHRISGVDYRGTTPFETYKEYIRKYIKEAKEMGVKPIVVGSISRKNFSEDGKRITRSGRHDLGENFSVIRNKIFLEGEKVSYGDHTYDYVASAKDVAEEFDDVPFINLTEQTARMYAKYGYSYCTSHLFFESDKTHTTALGAALIAREFAILLKRQASSESNPKKKAVLQALADEIVINKGVFVTPYNGDMGLAYVGAEVTKTFTVSGFEMPSENGRIKISVDNGFKISLDKTNWGESVEIKYSNSTFMAPVYVRANTSRGGIVACQLTVTDGATTKTQEIKIENIDKGAGEEVFASWTLANKSKAAIARTLEASDVTMSEMFIEDHTRIPISPNKHREMMLFNIDGSIWPSVDFDKVSSRYVEFKAKVPNGKIMNISEVSLDICGFGGNNSCYKVYLSTNDDFSDPVLLGEGARIPKDKSYTITKEMLMRVYQGQNIYLRVYPWMRVSEKVQGKTIGISDVKIKGTLTDVPAPKKSTQRRSVSRSGSSASKSGGSATKTGSTASRTGNAASKGGAVKKPVTAVKKK